MKKWLGLLIAAALMPCWAICQDCQVIPVHTPRTYVKPDDSAVEATILRGQDHFVVKLEEKRRYGTRKEHTIYQCGILSANLDTMSFSTFHAVDHVRVIKVRSKQKIYYYEIGDGLKLIREEEVSH